MTESEHAAEAERARLEALRRCGILDTAPEPAFDAVTRLAARLAGVEMAFICFVDEARQWFKACSGLALGEAPRTAALCNHAIQQDGILIVSDTHADERARNDPMVVGEPFLRFYAALPLTTSEGHKLGALCVADRRALPAPDPGAVGGLADLAAILERDLELRRAVHGSESAWRELRAMADSLPVQLSFLDRDLTYRFVNQRYADWYGRDDILGRRIHEVMDEAGCRTANSNLRHALEGNAITYENKVRTIGGVTRNVLVSVVPKLVEGKVEGLYLAAVDISAQKETEEKLSLLNAEFDHRLKNALATVQALIGQAQRAADGKDDLAASLSRRIGAMAHAYEVIHQAQAGGLDMQTIFRTQLEPYIEGRAGRLVWRGPQVVLKPNAGLAILIAVHELVVNSTKFGALSVTEGEVAVDWREEGDGQPRLVLEWKESAGPRVAVPPRKGYGAATIEQLLPYDVGASSELSFEPDGVRWRLTAPLARIAATPAPQGPLQRPAAVAVGAAPPQPQRELEGTRILVAEDSAHIAFSLEASLKAEGVHVVGPVATLGEARQLAARELIDIAIVDINLNNEMSFPLIDELRRRGVEVIASTGYDLKRQFPELAAELPVLKKPFTTQQLLAILQAVPAAKKSHGRG